MEIISDLLSGDKHTLYFIGNGFDLFHEQVKSKFVHFYSWLNLKDKEHEQFVMAMEELFPKHGLHGNMLWTDFEKTLGSFDVEQVHRNFAGHEGNRFFDEGYQARAANWVHEIFSKIPQYLKEWAANIDIKTVKPKLTLATDSRYLTFNYTLLLENVYHIPSEQIFHIHHSIKDKTPLITGHNMTYPKYFDDIDSVNIQKSYENLATEINRLKKPVNRIIEEHKDFFKSLADIDKVIVFGHSLSEIDIPYFKEVIFHVKDRAKWNFTIYGEAEKEKYETIVKRFNNYFNASNVLGVSQYNNKMRIENCNYINIQDDV